MPPPHIWLHLGGGGVVGLLAGALIQDNLDTDPSVVWICGLVGGVIGLIIENQKE